MPKRFTDGYFALGLIAGISSTVLFVIAVDFANSPEYFANAEASENKAESYDPAQNRWWLFRSLIYLEDSFAQWVMAAFTIIAAYYLWRTFDATRSAVIETRRIGEAQVRAYLTFQDVSIEAKIENGLVRFSVWCEIINSGQSPARNVTVSAKIRPNAYNAGQMFHDFTAQSKSPALLCFNQKLGELRFVNPGGVLIHLTVKADYLDVFTRPPTDQADYMIHAPGIPINRTPMSPFLDVDVNLDGIPPKKD